MLGQWAAPGTWMPVPNRSSDGPPSTQRHPLLWCQDGDCGLCQPAPMEVWWAPSRWFGVRPPFPLALAVAAKRKLPPGCAPASSGSHSGRSGLGRGAPQADKAPTTAITGASAGPSGRLGAQCKILGLSAGNARATGTASGMIVGLSVLPVREPEPRACQGTARTSPEGATASGAQAASGTTMPRHQVDATPLGPGQGPPRTRSQKAAWILRLLCLWLRFGGIAGATSCPSGWTLFLDSSGECLPVPLAVSWVVRQPPPRSPKCVQLLPQSHDKST